VERTNLSIQAKQLYEPYKNWCEENGEKYETMKGFSQRLVERGFKKQKDGSGRVRYYGLALRPEDDDPGGLLNTPPEPPDDGAPPLGDEDAPSPLPGPTSGRKPEAPTRPKSAVGASEEPGRPLPPEGPSEALSGDPGPPGGPPGAPSPAPDETAAEVPTEAGRPEHENGPQKAENSAENTSVRSREELRARVAEEVSRDPRAVGLLERWAQGYSGEGREKRVAANLAHSLYATATRWEEALPFVEEYLRGRAAGGEQGH